MIVVCAAGSSISIEHDCDALIHAWYPGSEGGKAIADIIFGKVSPSENCLLHSIIAPISCLALHGLIELRYTRDNILYPFGYLYGDGCYILRWQSQCRGRK